MSRRIGLAFVAIILAGGASPALAAMFTYSVVLSGPAESPPNASPGIGWAIVDYEDAAHTLRVRVTFSGLIGTTTSAHIHAPTEIADAGTAGVATTTPTFVGFPLGVTSGVYDETLDLTHASSWNPSFINANGGTPEGAEAALAAAMAARKAYVNVHTTAFGAGEIRGFLPEPGTLILLGTGAAVMLRRRREDASRP